MNIDTSYFAVMDPTFFGFIAIPVIVVGGYLWWKPRSSKSKKASGVGDHGQYRKS